MALFINFLLKVSLKPLLNQETKIRFTGYAFVVETDLCQIISALEKFGYAVVSLQQVVDTWEAGLKVSGGALAPEKTFW